MNRQGSLESLGLRFPFLFIGLALMGCGGGDSLGSKLNATDFLGSALCCKQPFWNVGQVDRLAELHHRFELTNRGNDTVVIGDVRSTCGCLVTQLENKTVGPGETLQIPASFQTPPLPGRFRKLIFVEVRGPMPETLELGVVGEVKIHPGLYVEPRKLDFGSIVSANPITHEVIVGRYDGSSVACDSISVSEGSAKLLTAPEVVAGTGSERVRFLFDPSGLPPGDHEVTFTIQTVRPQPFQSIPLKARFRISAAWTFVESIYVSRLRGGETLRIPLFRRPPVPGCEITECRFEGDARIQARLAPAEEESTMRFVEIAGNPVPLAGAEGAVACGDLWISVKGVDESRRIPVVAGVTPP